MAATVRKVSLAIGNEELTWAEDRAEREGKSVSAVLTEVARAARETELHKTRQRQAWEEYLAWATDGRGFTSEELEAARRELDGK